ncbi:Probable zinc metallopeptidase EGY3, chloroplastic [Linum grandiflorum]
MATTLFPSSTSSSFSPFYSPTNKIPSHSHSHSHSGNHLQFLSASCSTKCQFGSKTHLAFGLVRKRDLWLKTVRLSAKEEQVALADDDEKREDKKEPEEDKKEDEELQEKDWKTDEEFKKFMGNPSIEAAIKLEKKRADMKLKELDKENTDNPLVGLFNRLVRDRLTREKERLEKAEETFKALDLNKLKSCFGFDTFFATDVRRFGDGGIFIGNLRRPIEEVIPKLEKKLSEAAGRDVVVWFMEEKKDDITKQACAVQPKAEIDLQFETTKLSNAYGYFSAVVLCVATFGTISLMSGFFLKPDATVDDYISNVVPLFGGFLTILGVSEVHKATILLQQPLTIFHPIHNRTLHRRPRECTTLCSGGCGSSG